MSMTSYVLHDCGCDTSKHHIYLSYDTDMHSLFLRKFYKRASKDDREKQKLDDIMTFMEADTNITNCK